MGEYDTSYFSSNKSREKAIKIIKARHNYLKIHKRKMNITENMNWNNQIDIQNCAMLWIVDIEKYEKWPKKTEWDIKKYLKNLIDSGWK